MSIVFFTISVAFTSDWLRKILQSDGWLASKPVGAKKLSLFAPPPERPGELASKAINTQVCGHHHHY